MRPAITTAGVREREEKTKTRGGRAVVITMAHAYMLILEAVTHVHPLPRPARQPEVRKDRK
jgi:hypothetical protein